MGLLGNSFGGPLRFGGIVLQACTQLLRLGAPVCAILDVLFLCRHPLECAGFHDFDELNSTLANIGTLVKIFEPLLPVWPTRQNIFGGKI